MKAIIFILSILSTILGVNLYKIKKELEKKEIRYNFILDIAKNTAKESLERDNLKDYERIVLEDIVKNLD